jgi:uncharacterized protein YhbP (UPF0306 family)
MHLNLKNMNNIKSILLIAAIGSITFTASAQQMNGAAPQAVQSAFTAKYPSAQVTKWKTKKDTSIALFKMSGKKYEAEYAQNGSWLSTARLLHHESSLPMETREYLKTSKFASWHIDDMKKVHTANADMYEVFIDNNSGNPSAYENGGSVSSRELCFDMKGKLTQVVSL